MPASGQGDQRKVLARSCLFCRSRKIRCDTKRPSCGSCESQRRECVYKLQAPKERPTSAAIDALRSEKRRLEGVILRLKISSPEVRANILNSISIGDGDEELQMVSPPASLSRPMSESRLSAVPQENDEDLESQPDGDLDVSPFFSVDEMGKLDSFGPSSALQSSIHHPITADSTTNEQIRNGLIANAILQRQREHELHQLPDLDGVPTPLAMHLLNLHWSRQHHTFLLTYRPAIMRDLLDGGPNCSNFLLNAMFACSSKFSQRTEVRDDPKDPITAGARFFRRCDELLAQESLLIVPTVPTVVGLLLLGSTFNARGATSKGWLYTGYALRMVYDLGLHLDCKATSENAEEVEVRRRVFWGAFICDKLQSLYLGRPVAIQLRDAHVSRQLMDTIEEKELWMPYVDGTLFEETTFPILGPPTPVYSVSTFQQFCLLSKIMTMIINKFYVVGATAANARASLQTIDDSLTAWNENLPSELRFDPSSGFATGARRPPPNVMNLHGIYHSLIILLHRPLISDGHLRSAIAPASSWKRCTIAARNITDIAIAYQSTYSFRGAPYLLSYALYVACTIHVRNAAASETSHGGENSSLLVSSLRCLDELSLPNPGVMRPASIIKKLVVVSNLNHVVDVDKVVLISQEPQPSLQPAADLDLDAILRMFPPRNPDTHEEMGILGTTYWFEQPLNEDLLYGFMDGQLDPLYDITPGMYMTITPQEA